MPRIDQHLGFTRFEADEYYKQALEAYKKGDFDMAVDGMKNAIAALPKKAEYYAARGFIYLEDGVTQSALDDFDQALRLFPHEMLAHYGRGIVAYKDQNWEEALQHFTNAYYADTQRAETLYYLALTYYHKRDFASAANLMKLANDRFEATADKRKADSARWLRELAKLSNKTAELFQGMPDKTLAAGSDDPADDEPDDHEAGSAGSSAASNAASAVNRVSPASAKRASESG